MSHCGEAETDFMHHSEVERERRVDWREGEREMQRERGRKRERGRER
jgi:hypothetical protein